MKPLRIAIAEDDWFVAEYLCSELAALGHASSAEQEPARS